jgi:hypothetical protein
MMANLIEEDGRIISQSDCVLCLPCCRMTVARFFHDVVKAKQDGKAVPVLKLAQHHEDIWRNGPTDPRILNFGIRRR